MHIYYVLIAFSWEFHKGMLLSVINALDFFYIRFTVNFVVDALNVDKVFSVQSQLFNDFSNDFSYIALAINYWVA